MLCVLIRLTLMNNCLILKKIEKMTKLCCLTWINPHWFKLPQFLTNFGSPMGVQAIKVQLFCTLLVYTAHEKRFSEFFRLCLHYNLYHNIPKIMINLTLLKEVLNDITS